MRIGIDPWTGSGNVYQLPPDLITFLNNIGVLYISQLGDQRNSTFLLQAWRTGEEWNIPIQWERQWKNYLQALTESHVRFNEDEDELIWGLSKKGHYSSKQGYDLIQAEAKPDRLKSWWIQLC